jgi:hypothetical protein
MAKKPIKNLSKYEIKQLFWETYPQFLPFKTNGKPQNKYPCDVRVAWVDFIDSLHRDGSITDQMAADITL